jgi:hypothetical protein
MIVIKRFIVEQITSRTPSNQNVDVEMRADVIYIRLSGDGLDDSAQETVAKVTVHVILSNIVW